MNKAQWRVFITYSQIAAECKRTDIELAEQAYELAVAEGITHGLFDVVAGELLSRDESRTMRTARKATI